jgi:hypothetical protein
MIASFPHDWAFDIECEPYAVVQTMLRIELAILHEEDYTLDLIGFDDIELQRLLEAQDNAPGLTDADAVPEVQPEPVARLGDLFVLGDHRVICGDLLEAPARLDHRSVDC